MRIRDWHARGTRLTQSVSQLFSAVVLAHLIYMPAVAAGDSIESFQWEHRIAIVGTAGGSGDPFVRRLIEEATAVQERDIAWFVVNPYHVRSNIAPVSDALEKDIRRYLDSHDAAQVVLLGKDGDMKYRSDKLDLVEIFSEIDAMPMRIMEMRRRGE